MEALYLLIPMSIVVVFIALWIFFRASDGGQFDDLVGPGQRILQDDDRPAQKDAAPANRTERPDLPEA
ncbi:cbb3-type cytochrome oxidase assembly protein CcoS [Lacisediminimonas sp.]|uniref:cbb3-type cytochrome oxidase assembly protein CcoS n=1 Tax=Lacisediminimonas sp. TaxID=3060582 RepID=UPI0027157938|nr:cbb3-type cytochrome oxidase assembly protein CcoS [Lacisediminimonas sp.]MDO8300388.1 cbb3-type cytochrome oxidase assembly protein CcoS [Lacisediminimonas sp.]